MRRYVFKTPRVSREKKVAIERKAAIEDKTVETTVQGHVV